MQRKKKNRKIRHFNNWYNIQETQIQSTFSTLNTKMLSSAGRPKTHMSDNQRTISYPPRKANINALQLGVTKPY